MRPLLLAVTLVIASAVDATAPVPGDLRVIWSGPADRPRIALTFDDGPHAEWTPRVIETLNQAHARATFFVVGGRLESGGTRSREILNLMIAGGHEIGNHGWSHSDVSKLSADRARNEITRTADLVERWTGRRPGLFRPPGGGVDFGTVRALASADVDAIVMWSIDPSDWTDPGRDRLWTRIAERLAPGSIILLHDIHRGTLDALPLIIDLIQAKGYELVTVSELTSG